MIRPALLATAAIAALALTPRTAAAQCAPDPVANGGSVTCTNVDADGFTSSSTGISVTVVPGASVTGVGGNDALRLNGAGTTVTNSGEVDGSDEGIDIRGANGSITNEGTGTITGDDRGIDADEVSGITITNRGTITGEDSDAVRLGDDGTVTNAAGATISGADEAIQAGDDFTLDNDGTIEADDEGIEAGDGATFTNTGTITAVDDAIQTNALVSITNSGTVSSSANDAIDIDNGSVVNLGTIIGLDGGEDGIDFDPAVDSTIVSTVANAGGAVIEGAIGINTDPANLSSQAVTNNGRITGRSGVAMALGAGEDNVFTQKDGIFEGLVDLGADDDLLWLDGDQAALVGGGALFDGGEGTDTLVTYGLGFDDIVAVAFLSGFGPSAYTVTTRNSDTTLSLVRLLNFENLLLNPQGEVYALADLVAPVPLPASGALLVGGLGALALARRRARHQARRASATN